MNDKEKSAAVAGGLIVLGSPIAFAAIMAVGIAFGAWTDFVAYKIWMWFVVPYLHAPPLTWFQMFCVTLLVGLYTPKRYVKDEKVDFSAALTGLIIGPALVLLIAYIAHRYYA